MPTFGGRLVAVVTLAAAALNPAGPAQATAGDGVTTSDPPAQAVLSTAPREISLSFSGTPDQDRSHLVVVDDAGRRVSSPDEPTRRGDSLTQAVSIERPGDYTVAYHVTFTDGREADGWRRFSVGTGRPPGPLSPADRAANAELVTSHQHGPDPISAILLVVNALVVAGVLVMLALTRPGRGGNPDAPEPRRLFRMPPGWSQQRPPD